MGVEEGVWGLGSKNQGREEIEFGVTVGSRYKWVRSKIEEVLDESFCSSSRLFLQFTVTLLWSLFHHVLVSLHQPVGDVAGLASSVWMSIWQRRENCKQPVFTSHFLFFFFIYVQLQILSILNQIWFIYKVKSNKKERRQEEKKNH